MGTVTTTTHAMTRVDIATGIPYGDFLTAFEAVAPRFDPEPFQHIADSGGSWADVEAAVTAMAPLQLMIYARIDTAPIFAIAGHRTKAVEYLLGNHVIAETMFRHDPARCSTRRCGCWCSATTTATPCGAWTDPVMPSPAWGSRPSPRSGWGSMPRW